MDAIAVLNAGSSSIKFSLFELDGRSLRVRCRGQIERIYTAPRFVAKRHDGTLIAEKSWPTGTHLGHDGALDELILFLKSEVSDVRLIGVGHRVVHGGVHFAEPVSVDAGVVVELEKLIPLAPLHQPHNLAPMRRILERLPALPQVACFDTAFHRTNPDLAQRFALPTELHEAGIRRYGFHGLSYEYIASVLGEFDSRAASGRTVVLHLGNGASMCALQSGRSITSTMSFTAVDGLPMGTRCGSLDPGVLLYLLEQRGLDARAIEKLLYHQSGLLGVSGISSDMRVLLDSQEPGAELAVALFCYRIRRELGSLAAALGGLDALVFTAGIGENSAALRRKVCHDASWLGVELDDHHNDSGGPRISAAASPVSAWVIPTHEELMIARNTLRILTP